MRRASPSVSQYDVPRYADHRQIAAHSAGRRPVMAVTGDDVTGAKAGPSEITLTPCVGQGPHRRLVRRPERRMRALKVCDCQ